MHMKQQLTIAPATNVQVGCDVVNISRLQQRIERYGNGQNNPFLDELFSQQEQQQAAASAHPAIIWAKLFAAKEAAMKVLGIGIGHGFSPVVFEVNLTAENSPQPSTVGLNAGHERSTNAGQLWPVTFTVNDECVTAAIIAMETIKPVLVGANSFAHHVSRITKQHDQAK